MGKDLKDMTRQEVHSYFKFKDYRGEQLKVVMNAIDYGIDTNYLRLFDDTDIPAAIMENMFTAMKEDYGVEAAAFLSTIRQVETGRILLEALKSGIPLHELQGIYQKEMLPIELREKILPLMQKREAVPEKIGEKMEFITEAVRELKEGLLRQGSFIEDLRKAMEENPDIFSSQEKEAGSEDNSYYQELEEQFRQTREDAERLLEEREETGRRLRELEEENKHLHEQLLIQQSYAAELQKCQNAQESSIQGNQQQKISRMMNNTTKMESANQPRPYPSFQFPFTRKRPGLLEKLAGELDAGQIAEIRLGIEDGLSEEQLILLADKTMDSEKIRELRMTMKILNERGQRA